MLPMERLSDSLAQSCEPRMAARHGHGRKAEQIRTSITFPLVRLIPEMQSEVLARFSERVFRVLHRLRRQPGLLRLLQHPPLRPEQHRGRAQLRGLAPRRRGEESGDSVNNEKVQFFKRTSCVQTSILCQ